MEIIIPSYRKSRKMPAGIIINNSNGKIHLNANLMPHLDSHIAFATHGGKWYLIDAVPSKMPGIFPILRYQSKTKKGDRFATTNTGGIVNIEMVQTLTQACGKKGRNIYLPVALEHVIIEGKKCHLIHMEFATAKREVTISNRAQL